VQYKSRFESRDEVQLPFVPQCFAANMCDARNDAIKIYCRAQKKSTAKIWSKYPLSAFFAPVKKSIVQNMPPLVFCFAQ